MEVEYPWRPFPPAWPCSSGSQLAAGPAPAPPGLAPLRGLQQRPPLPRPGCAAAGTQQGPPPTGGCGRVGKCASPMPNFEADAERQAKTNTQ